MLTPAALYERAVPERHRLIFYLGHLEAFDWNHIAARAMGETRFHPDFDRLFEAGIDPDSTSLPSDSASDWPSREEVCGCDAQVRRRVDELLLQAPPDVVLMALEHRLMHAETLAYLLQNLSYDLKTPLSVGTAPDLPKPVNTPVEIPGGLATLGRDRGDGFGWDNEFEKHFVRVPAFCIDRYNVTNEDISSS